MGKEKERGEEEKEERVKGDGRYRKGESDKER